MIASSLLANAIGYVTTKVNPDPEQTKRKARQPCAKGPSLQQAP